MLRRCGRGDGWPKEKAENDGEGRSASPRVGGAWAWGLTLKTPWISEPYQDDQSNQAVMSNALAPSPGNQPTVCSAPMP